jgi:hypothetical protein
MTTDINAEPIRAHGKHELADYLAGMRLHYRQSIRPAFKALLGVIAVAYLVAAISEVFFVRSLRSAVPLLAGPLFFSLVYGLLLPYYVRKAFKQQARFVVPIDYEVTRTEFHLKNQFVEARLPLDSFIKWRANRAMILMYMTGRTYQILPKRFFSREQDFQRLQDYLSAIPRSK